ncbi:sensor histidine kinase, partial [Verrucomicrobiota bacterium]
TAPRPSDDPDLLARRLSVSYEISKATIATLNLPEILSRVLEVLFEIFESSERALVLLVDPDTGGMREAAVKRRAASDLRDVAVSRTILNHVMRNRGALLCRDAASDVRFADAQSIADWGIRAVMAAPLLFKDELHGVIYVETRNPGLSFTTADLELLTVAAGQVAGCLANADLHAKLVANERLAAVGQTVAGLSHCIKNILQGVKGGAFLVDRGLAQGDLDRVEKGWRAVQRKTDFMEELTWDLLTFSKARPPQYEPTDLNALCSEVCEIGRERAPDGQVDVTFEPAEGLEPIEVDPKGIRRSLLNLVSNAVDACDDAEGRVTVEVLSPDEDGMVRVVVRDTGGGMSEGTLSKLFTVFFSTKGSKGTGLGLPITRKIVEEHGGRIQVESEEGSGTVFTVSLPAARRGEEEKGEGDGGHTEETADC